MPRSFLVKTHQNSKKPNYGGLKSDTEESHCNTHGYSRLHRDVSPRCDHSSSTHRPQLRAQSLSSCTVSIKTDQLLLPSSPNSIPLSFSDPYSRCSADVFTSVECCTKVNMEMDSGRTESLYPSSVPLLALFPTAPPGGSSITSQEHYDCLDCHKEYLSFSSLTKHKQLQCEWSNKKFFSCKYCEKEYSSLGALKMHIRTHTLPCVCKFCGKAFSRPWLLQGHIRTHTGEKPFTCLHCSRAFADRSNLRAHLQTHSEVKKYQCVSCFKTFSRISLLAKHQEAGCLLS